MKIGMRLAGVATAAIATFAFASPASAQATRTWVSGVGDDVNPCSRTAPCKTFAGAISKTAAGGEINCLDPGGFGTLTITKSITVDCTGTFGSTLNSGGINGFVINDSLSATPGQSNVILRGISINGAGSTPGLNGVRFISGKSLVMQDVFVQNQKSGSGISIAPSTGTTSVNLEDVTLTNGLGGMVIAPTGSATVKVVLRNVRISNNTGNGFEIGTPGGTSVTATIDKSILSNNNRGIVSNAAGTAKLMVIDSTIASNTLEGLATSGAPALTQLSGTGIHGNATGVSITSGAVVNSISNNMVRGNGVDVSGTPIATVTPN